MVDRLVHFGSSSREGGVQERQADLRAGYMRHGFGHLSIKRAACQDGAAEMRHRVNLPAGPSCGLKDLYFSKDLIIFAFIFSAQRGKELS
jgi:hypothetical protein